MDEEIEMPEMREIDEANMGDYAEFVEMNEFGEVIMKNDCIAQFKGHKDSVYCVTCRPVEPYDVYASGDGADKAIVWQVRPKQQTEQQEEEMVEQHVQKMVE